MHDNNVYLCRKKPRPSFNPHAKYPIILILLISLAGRIYLAFSSIFSSFSSIFSSFLVEQEQLGLAPTPSSWNETSFLLVVHVKVLVVEIRCVCVKEYGHVQERERPAIVALIAKWTNRFNHGVWPSNSEKPWSWGRLPSYIHIYIV